MSEKIYLHLLILCGIFGIIATLSEDNTKSSSDFLERKKRVISHLPEDRATLYIEDSNYVVNIKEYNRVSCVGTILSHQAIITAASCARHQESVYTVHSGTIYIQYANRHNVTSKILYNGNPPYDSIDGIALMKVHPPFQFNSETGKISLFTGLLSAGTPVTVYGYGCFYPPKPGPQNSRPNRIRSITLPILNHEECQNIYQRYYTITDKLICTFHELKYCAHKDIGAPLVVNGSLVGIHTWKGEFRGQPNPDVYVNLVRSEYREWIQENIVLM